MKIRHLALSALFACSPAQPQPNIEHPPILTMDAAAQSYLSPSRWSLFEVSTVAPVASSKVPEGTIHVGGGGERWLVRANNDRETANTLAPERLIGLAPFGQAWRFLGTTGTLYEAPSPLAQLTRIGDPFKDAYAVALGQHAVLAIDEAGDLNRTVDGHAWKKIDIAPRDGMLRAVAMSGAVGLALAVPQRIYATKDDGTTWKPIAAPGSGVRGLKTTENEVILLGEQDQAFDPASDTFKPRVVAKTPPRGRRMPPLTAMFGRTGVAVLEDPELHRFTFAVFDVGGSTPPPRALDVLDGCFHVQPAIWGHQIFLACDAVGTLESGIDKTVQGPLDSVLRSRPQTQRDGGKPVSPMITVLMRSDDGGKTFVVDSTFEGGMPQITETPLYTGEGGFVFLGSRCTSYPRVCMGPRLRATGQSGWLDIPEDPNAPRHQAFASRAGHPIYSIGTGPQGAVVYKWGQGAPEAVGTVTPKSATQVSIDVDDAGVVRGFLRADKPRGFELRGTAMTDLSMPGSATMGAFSGRFGLASDGSSGYETIDAGKSWHKVGFPLGVSSISRCMDEGCVTSRGLRLGWDGQGPAPVRANDAPKYATPLKCRANGSWTVLGGGDLPTAENVDQGPYRWVLPTRDVPGAVTLVANKWSDPPTALTRTVLIGPAPQPPTYGASTTMHVQPNGVVVVRYSYLRARNANGDYNPVDMSAVWFRPQTGKVIRGALPKLPSFRVRKDPTNDQTPTPHWGIFPEIVSLGSKGLYFRSAGYPDGEEWTLYHLRDDAKIEKTKLPELRGEDLRVVDLGGSLGVVANDTQWIVYNTVDQKESVLGVMLDEDAPVSIFDIAGKPSFFGTLRSSQPRAWAIPIAAKSELPPAIAMPTQLAMGNAFPGCTDAQTDPKVYRAVIPWVHGSRRPVAIEVDGVKHVLATDEHTIRAGTGGGTTCWSALSATMPDASSLDPETEDEISALIPPTRPNESILFRAKRKDWPAQISMRSLSCTFEAGPLPPELDELEGVRP